jgi:hypothetical protein
MNQRAKIEFLQKYAQYAESLLAQKFESFSSQEVEKLAAALIEKDVEAADQYDHVVDLVKTSQHIARGFAAELTERLGSDQFSKLSGAMEGFLKATEKSRSFGKSLDVAAQGFGSSVAKTVHRN